MDYTARYPGKHDRRETMCVGRSWSVVLYAAMFGALLLVLLALTGLLPAARHLLTLDLALAWWLGRCHDG